MDGGWGGVINKKLRQGYACKRAIENLEEKKEEEEVWIVVIEMVSRWRRLRWAAPLT